MKKPTNQLTRSGKDYALVTDNAEFRRLQSAVMSSARNFKSEHARPYDGAAKSVVERCFRRLQVEWGTRIPGCVHKESEKRNGPENDVVLADEDLRK